ncbi:MAG TPA: LacI family DNA-binding transcriptional regulator [Microlunatus sp.]
MVTIKEVAARAGVSTAVVSAAISGAQGTIRMSEATRERVERAIAETGYRANHAAKSLSLSRSGVIAAVVPKIANPIFELAIRGMQDAAEADGDVLLLADALWIEPGSHLMSRIAGTGMVDGFLLRTTDWGSETAEELTSRSIPFVILQTPIDGGPVAVWVDDRAGIDLATSRLLDQGHRRIALIGGPTGGPTSDGRIDGYRDAMRRAQVRADLTLVRQVGYEPSDVGAETHRLLTSVEPPTALIIDNVVAAPGALAAITDLGIRVPEELSLIVYHDLPLADSLRPAPTTVRMPVFEAGRRGYLALRRLIDGKPARSTTIARPAPKLIDRGSVGPLR